VGQVLEARGAGKSQLEQLGKVLVVLVGKARTKVDPPRAGKNQQRKPVSATK
jgi:hypothetical protein